MKLTTVIILGACMQISAAGFGQTVTLKANEAALTDVLKSVKEQTGYVFFYPKGLVSNAAPISVNVKNKPLGEFLTQVLQDDAFVYSIEDKTVFIKPAATKSKTAPAVQTIDVTGVITDESGHPLAGVSITVKGKNIRTVTDENGKFQLVVDLENAVLQLAMLGFEKQEYNINGRKQLSIQLRRDIAKITQVEVTGNTGYQKIPRERVTGAFDVISSRQLSNRVQTNVMERLEGQAPGLMLINGKDDGDPNGDGLTIRGVSTLYGTKRPLIVIDNFPFEGNMNAINPNDVASITILKDAAAASIWGARAANGVIVITTKTAKSGKTQFTYNNNFQFEAKPDLSYLHRLSSAYDIAINQQLLTTGYESGLKSSGSAFNTFERLYMDSVAGRISPAQFQQGRDSLSGLDNSSQIKDLLLQAPITQNHSLAFMGGNEKNNYYGSIRLTDAKGAAINDKNTSYSFLLKDNYTISPKLQLSVSANLTYSKINQSAFTPASIYKLKPYEMLQDANGKPLAMDRNADPRGQNNSNQYTIAQRIAWGLDDESYYPLLENNRNSNVTNTTYNRLQAALKYKLLPWMDVDVSYQLENGYSYNKLYSSEQAADVVKLVNDMITPQKNAAGAMMLNADGTLMNPGFNIPKGGKITELRNNYTAYTLRALLNINKSIASRHDIAAVIGAERRQSKNNGNSLTKYGYDDNSLQFVDIDAQRLKNLRGTLQTIQNGFGGTNDYFIYTDDRFVSGFGNASYTLDKKYVVSGSMRIDATNLFGTDPKYLYKPMWSTGVSWIMSNENFLKNISWIDYMQLRATYGLNGNIPKRSGPFMIAQSGTNYFNNLQNNIIVTPANNELRWEKTEVTNVGLDFTFLRNRINGKLDYYERKSTDLLGDQELNPTYGFPTATVNTASMINKGWELQLTTKNIRNTNFEWSTTVSYALNHSRITKVALSPDYSTPYNLASGAPYVVGDPYGSLYSFRFGGLTADKGQIQLLDASGKVVKDAMYSDLGMVAYSGSTRPIGTGAFSNNFRYRNFELNFMFVYYGDFVKRQSLARAANGVQAFDDRLQYAWQQPGDELHTIVPNIIMDKSANYATGLYGNFLDANVFDATYIKLRDVTLQYNFSPELLKRWKYIHGLQILANARNILTITKNNLDIDPEAFSGGVRTLPVMPSYSFGINLDF